ncbi:2-oxo acid dehydrogenase subunit E2 [Streptomyces purpurogeneiscleroticus]|uniref:2-oxo acid dehydrogenase subunit E2 n=1 Tax=Streptomyces purpurogeneiscleroticus TaxID=68259 RepID=UPI001CC0D818|nr:2-oxo acid dehydrogenase subunit E2 [Streptomyces purpurogeneiscleroticus]MBZ4019634.1 dehydrogenase [Streptomyces purpurogeneiscleroticus]
MGEFRMPALGADMEQGTLTEWLVHPGDHVTKGDPVAVIETAKSDIEVECFESGVITELLAEPGDLLPVGAPLAEITSEAEAGVVPPAAGEGAAPGPVSPEPPAEPATAEPAPPMETVTSPLVRHLAQDKHIDLATVHGTGRGGRVTRNDVERAASPPERVRATPMARRVAAELNIDLATVQGTGDAGAVRVADVRGRAAAHPPLALPDGRSEAGTAPRTTTAPRSTTAPQTTAAAPHRTTSGPAAGGRDQRREAMRSAIAALMARSQRDIPHYYLSRTIDLTHAMAWMNAHNRDRPVSQRLLPACLLLKAAARAAREVPETNGHWTDGRFHPAGTVRLGVAIALRGGGLVAPVLRDADEATLPQLMARLKDLANRVRAGRLKSSEMGAPTITVTSIGDRGADAVYGVIHPPQVALVGFGTVQERPCAVDGLLGIRPTVIATLAGDHRASDGATGARYLASVERLLQQPEEL